jgi:phage terminase large subunit-like protein
VKKPKRKAPAKPRPPTRAERNIAWIERHLRVPEGKFVGRPLKVAPFMRDDLRAIYDNPDGTRLAIISRGRKNAKTTESAMLLLLHLCGPEAKPNSQLNSAAQSKEQAAVLFSLAAKMVRMSPTLAPVVIIRDTVKQLACPQLGTLYKALSADASTAYGLSPAFTFTTSWARSRARARNFTTRWKRRRQRKTSRCPSSSRHRRRPTATCSRS